MKKNKIVIIEDEQLIALDIAETLDQLGHSVVNSYRKGENAVANIQNDHPDLILMDIELAGVINGIETAHKIEEQLDVPIIYLTAYADNDFLEKAKVTTPYGYIVKPFERRTLQANMEMALYHHQMEKRIKKSEAKYRAVVEDQSEFIIRFDEQGKITFLNKSYARFRDCDTPDLIGKQFLDCDDKKEKEIFSQLKKELSPEKPVLRKTIKTRLSNQSVKWIDWSYRAMFDDKNLFLGYQAVGRDITEKKQAEFDRDQIQKQFFQAQKMEVIGRLAGSIAHDFNNLLTAINGYTDLAITKLNSDHPACKDLETIRETAEKAEILIRQLLGFSRKQIVRREVIDIHQKIEKLDKLLSQMIGSDVHIQKSIFSESLYAKVDPNQFDQILINLVVNAKDAIEGKGKILITTNRSKIPQKFDSKKEIDPAKSYVKISVIDDGSGMTDDTMQKIFEPFFTTKEKDKGTGLGLATVFSIVQQNEGFVDVESGVGAGSKFHIYFAEEEKIVDAVKIPEAKEKKATEKRSILVVEDEVNLRDLMLDILEETPHHVISARNAVNALEMIEARKPKLDMLITDIQMPEMNGYELAKKMKIIYPELIILFVSGHTDHQKIRQEISENKVDFLQKPFNYDSFIKKIELILK